jgi:hypothetical protein
MVLCLSSGVHAQAPAATPEAEPPVAPAVAPELCAGRSILVFDEETSELAADGMMAYIELHLAAKNDPDLGNKLAAGLKASGCAVTHWDGPLVSVSVVDRKKTAFFGDGKKEENYVPRKLTDKELDAHDVVVWIQRSSTEKRKTRQGEGLRIDYKSEAQVRARGQKKVDLDAKWQYAQDDLPASFGGFPSITDEEAARKKGVEKFAPTRDEKVAAFDTSVHQAVRTALAGLGPATQ